MSDDTVPVFVIGSGRSGTRALFKAFSKFTGVEAHHEYCCTHIQPIAAKYFMGRATKSEVERVLGGVHQAAVLLSTERIWMDTSNKLTWLVEPLITLFPNAKFVNLIRDGRKVALSYVRKLGDEMYDPRSVAVLASWLSGASISEPPPEKRYWWNIPQTGQPFHDSFSDFTQLQRAAYHWVESNRVARESLEQFVPFDQRLTLHLEELVASRDTQEQLLSFVGLNWADHFATSLSRPENVIVPIDFAMSSKDLEEFRSVASKEMKNLGYDLDQPEYQVDY